VITRIASEGNVLAYETSGKVTEQEYQRATQELRAVIAEHGSVRVLTRLPDSGIPSMEFAAIDDRLRFAKDHLRDLDRVAVVGGPSAAEWVAKASDKLTPVKMRHFDAGDEAAAWTWLQQPS
jgi:hypothetical protein